MKRILSFLLAILCLLPLCACRSGSEEELDLSLDIRAFVLKREYEGTGYWKYDEETIQDGKWILYDTRESLTGDVVYAQEPLAVGETRIMAAMGYHPDAAHMFMQNLNLFVDFDGYVQVETEDPTDQTIHLAYSLNEPQEPNLSNWVESNSFQINAPVTVNVCPIGKETLATGIVSRSTLVGHTYTIVIRAYRQNGAYVASAKLKMTTLPDEAYPKEVFTERGYDPLDQANEERTRFCSITLTELTYSDFYEIVDAREKEAA